MKRDLTDTWKQIENMFYNMKLFVDLFSLFLFSSIGNFFLEGIVLPRCLSTAAPAQRAKPSVQFSSIQGQKKDARSRRYDSNGTGFMEFRGLCVELWPFLVAWKRVAEVP